MDKPVEPDRPLVALLREWHQASANYDAEVHERVLVVSEQTTVGEIMRWARTGKPLGRGDVRLVEAEVKHG